MPRRIDPDLIPTFVQLIDSGLLASARRHGRITYEERVHLMRTDSMLLGLDEGEQAEFLYLTFSRMAFLGLADRVDPNPTATVADAMRLVGDRVALALLDAHLRLFGHAELDNLEKTASLLLRCFGDAKGQLLGALMDRVQRNLAEFTAAVPPQDRG